MKLLYAPQSPFARKVRAAAIELGLGDAITLELAQVAPGRPNQAYAEQVNPLRKIPALITDEQILYDSTVILEYLNSLAGGSLVPSPGDPARWRVLTSHALAQGMCDSAVLIRYETALRPEPLRWSTWIDDQWDKIQSGLGWFEGHAEALERPFDVAQLTLACLLGYLDFRYPDAGWRERSPRVAAWFERVSARPSLAQTKPSDTV